MVPAKDSTHEKFLIFGVRKSGNLAPTMHFITSCTVRKADNLLGAHEIIALAPADVKDYSYVVVATEKQALQRGWKIE